eukprot:g10004.t1
MLILTNNDSKQISKIDKSLTVEFQVPNVLSGSEIQVCIGSYDPLTFIYPCTNIPGCVYKAKEDKIQITIQNIDAGTYTLQIKATKAGGGSINQLSHFKSAKILFDIVPSDLNLIHSLVDVHEYHKDAYEKSHKIFTSPGLSSFCQKPTNFNVINNDGSKKSSIKMAIVSSFAHGLNGQIILLSKLVEEMSKKKGIEIKWVTADEESPDENDMNDDNLLRLKHWNVKYVKAIMKAPNDLYTYANKSLENLVKITYDLYDYEMKTKMDYRDISPSNLHPPKPTHVFKYKKLIYKMFAPVIKELQSYDIVHFTTRELRRWEDQLLVVALRYANVKVVIAEPGSIENHIVDYVDAYIVPSHLAKRHMEQLRPQIPTFVLKPYLDKNLYERYWPFRQKFYNRKGKKEITIAFLGRFA